MISHTVELPFGRGKPLLSSTSGVLNKMVSGWSVGGFATFHTGFPLSLSSIGNSGVSANPSVLRPNSTGQSAKLSSDVQDRLNRFFDTSVFTVPQSFTFGNTGRNLPDVRGPGKRNYDLSLIKTTTLTETMSVQFRAEAYNLTNTPYFFFPGTNLGSPSFGVISGSQGERQWQMSLKFLW